MDIPKISANPSSAKQSIERGLESPYWTKGWSLSHQQEWTKGLHRSFGHNAGVNVLKDILKSAKNLGCKVLTVYAFSTEN